MNMRYFLFAGWCMTLFASSVASSYYAWSPFADGKRDQSSGVYGPNHK